MEANRVELNYVEQTLLRFEEIGLCRNETFNVAMQVYADAVVEGYPYANVSRNGNNRITQNAPYPRLAVLWKSDVEETGELLDYFRNVLLFIDHCFDVANLEDFERLFQQILAISSEDWQPRLARTLEQRRLFSRPKHQLAVESGGTQHIVSIEPAKDFDLNLIAQLNSLVPDNVDAKYAFCGDGGMILLVWLPRRKIVELGNYCGMVFDVP